MSKTLSPILYASLFANALFLYGVLRGGGGRARTGSSSSLSLSLSHLSSSSGAAQVEHELEQELANINMKNANSTDQLPGYHPQRLTHLIVPFHTSHINRVENMLKSWTVHPPCSLETDPSTPRAATTFHLLFYSSCDMRRRDKISELEQRIRDALQTLPAPTLRCFRSFEFAHANLSGPSDRYYRGTRLMIEKLLLGKVRLTVPAGYAYYMEPDVLPVRANWLNALDTAVRWPNAQFWIKGSLYRGNNKGVYATRHPPQYYHINGAAIYNLGDKAFRSFYVKHYRPFVQAAASKAKERSYDTDFYRFLHSMDTVEVSRRVFHKFVYTDVVQNHWRSSYSVGKLRTEHANTYLVHGGYQKP